jgi:hypothetical protein
LIRCRPEEGGFVLKKGVVTQYKRVKLMLIGLSVFRESSMYDVFFFPVKLGQCVFVAPSGASDYCTMIDCGHDGDFHPIDQLIKHNWIPKNANDRFEIGNLTLTNYDHDHFSGLPNLQSKVHIRTAAFSNNLSSSDLLSLKPEKTDALKALVDMKNSYTGSASNWNPPFKKYRFSLTRAEMVASGFTPNENDFSQLVFIDLGAVVICFPGDLLSRSWAVMLQKPEVQAWLHKTTHFVASHHGRKNGYNDQIFKYCTPQCVIFSDKEVIHSTQEGMSGLYSQHVKGSGVLLQSESRENALRKVLTTRNDGLIRVKIDTSGAVSHSHAI